MDIAFPYCKDPHIDPATKNLVLNLIKSIRSVVPAVNPPEPTLPDSGDELKTQDEIREILFEARTYSEALRGIFNPEELDRYLRYIADYQDIIDQIEKLYEEMKSMRDYAIKFSTTLAGLIEDHLKLTLPVEDNPPLRKSTRKTMKSPGGTKLKIV